MAIENFQEEFPNNPNISSEITQSVIDQTTPQGFIEDDSGRDPYSQQLIDNVNAQHTVAPIGAQGAAMYPGLKHNINVGTQSGSIIGSQGVYVPGGNIMAMDPVLERRKAIDDAAKARAKAIKPFEYGDPTKLKDARFQETSNKLYYDGVNRMMDAAKEKYGKDFSVVLQDQSTKEGREFVQFAANHEFINREMDQITNLFAEIDKGLESGDLAYTDETLKI